MTFNSNLVSVIKVSNKVLREDRSNPNAPTVFIPFLSEYSIMIKNLASRKASVKVSIDGVDVLSGNSLIVNPNTSIDLERFVDNMNKGNKFKFIEKTKQISDHRGDKIDDGIVRIEYQFEQELPAPIYIKTSPWYPYQHNFNYYDPNTVYGCSNVVGSAGVNNIGLNSSVNCFASNVPVNDDGITVKGSVSDQKFSAGYIGVLESTVHVITMMLRGVKDNKTVNTPILSRMKNKCESCGTVYRGFPQFCSKCGTAINAEI